MMEKTNLESKRFVQNMRFYFIGNFATKILQILFIPMYTKYIDTSDFGYYNLVISLFALLLPILYQSIWDGLLRFIIEKESEARKIISITTKYFIGLTIIYVLIFIIINEIFSPKFGIAILLMSLGQVGASYWQFSARALKENKIYSIAIVINSTISIVLNIVLILVFDMGLLALFIANSVGNLCMVFIIENKIRLLQTLSKYSFDTNILISIIKYSFPLAINSISWFLVISFNSLVISYWIGMAENGIYSMANRFGTIMVLITGVANMAWQEESFRVYGEKDSIEYCNRVFEILVRIIFGGISILIPVTYIFYNIFVFGDYAEGVILTPLIYLTVGYSAFASHIGSVFLARKESKVVLITTIIGGIVSGLGGIILLNFMGLLGVVVTSLIGTILMFFLRVIKLKKVAKLRINYSFITTGTVFSLCTMFFSTYYSNSIVALSVIVVISGVYFFIINKKIVLEIYLNIRSRIY